MPSPARRSANAHHPERYKRFRSRLVLARQEAGLTQQEAADQLGRLQSFVSRCENGERRVDIVELTAFAKVYGKRLDFFVTWK